MLAEARADIGYADHKASMVLAALGIGFSAVLGGLFASDWRPTDLTGWAEFFWWVGGVSAVASVIFAGLAVWPRIGDPDPTHVYYWATYSRASTPIGHSANTWTRTRSTRSRGIATSCGSSPASSVGSTR